MTLRTLALALVLAACSPTSPKEPAGPGDQADTDRSGTNPDGNDTGMPCPDEDEDGVCDSDDICTDGDDTVDSDGDGEPDDCDACPLDNPNDSDRDMVCDSDDQCPRRGRQHRLRW